MTADYLATINSRGCDGTGITEELIAQCYNGGRGSIFALVELQPEVETLNRKTGQKRLNFVIGTVEPVVAKNAKVEKQLTEHTRGLALALNYERKLMGDQPIPFDEHDGPAPKVKDFLQQGAALTDTDDDGNPRIHDPEAEAEQAPDDEVAAMDAAIDEEEAEPTHEDTDEPGQASVEVEAEPEDDEEPERPSLKAVGDPFDPA